MQDCDEDSQATGAGSGGASDVPLAYYDRSTSSWRTSQGCLLEGSTRFSGRWPASGTMRSGKCYARPTSAPLTDARASSSWPTPNVPNGGRSTREDTFTSTGKKRQVDLQHAARHWPTPQTTDAASAARHTTTTGVSHAGTTLTDAIRQWPTPRSEDSESSGRRHGRGTSDTLTAATRDHEPALFPTPAARDYRSPNRLPYAERGGGMKGEQLNNFVAQIGPRDQGNHNTTGSPPAASAPRVLNPRWVLALMGFPTTWLDGAVPRSKRRETRSSLNAPK